MQVEEVLAPLEIESVVCVLQSTSSLDILVLVKNPGLNDCHDLLLTAVSPKISSLMRSVPLPHPLISGSSAWLACRISGDLFVHKELALVLKLGFHGCTSNLHRPWTISPSDIVLSCPKDEEMHDAINALAPVQLTLRMAGPAVAAQQLHAWANLLFSTSFSAHKCAKYCQSNEAALSGTAKCTLRN